MSSSLAKRPTTTSSSLETIDLQERLLYLRTSFNDRRNLWFWVRVWLPVVLAIAVIATESTEYFGADQTSGPFRLVFEYLFGRVAPDRWDAIHHIIRKTGHFIGYGLVGLSWLRAWWMTLPESNFFQDALLALLGTAAVASADEIHQTFLPNRTGLASDVVIDCCGAIALQLLVYLFMRLFRPKELARAT
jgi:VanZ family protein